MESIYDVLRAAVDGLLRVGGFTEAQHQAAHDVVNSLDPVAKEAARKAEVELSDAEQAELARLQEKAQRAAEAAQAQPDTAASGG